MDTPPDSPSPLAGLLARAVARVRLISTVFHAPDAHAEITNEEVTYRDPEAGLVTTQAYTPAYLGCRHFARNAKEVGGECGACHTLVCSNCLITCPTCGSAVCLQHSGVWSDDNRRYCLTCLRAMGWRKRFTTVRDFFFERQE